uniref:Uncharacterized protein n=2 Tax=Triticum urartu TaxID=4572 RepID=A0A8R7QRY2_TRIUA
LTISYLYPISCSRTPPLRAYLTAAPDLSDPHVVLMRLHHLGTPKLSSSDSLPRLAGQSSKLSAATPVSSAILSSADVKFSRLDFIRRVSDTM